MYIKSMQELTVTTSLEGCEIFAIVQAQTDPPCCYISNYGLDYSDIYEKYKQLKEQYLETAPIEGVKVYLLKIIWSEDTGRLISYVNSELVGYLPETTEIIEQLLNSKDCEVLEMIDIKRLEEARKRRAKRKAKRKKPYSSITYSTGYPNLDMDFFNRHMGTDFDQETADAAESSDGGSTASEAAAFAESLVEAGAPKRYIKRYYIRPQNIFCSKKSDILHALVNQVGDNNCSVYSLKSLADHDDVHLLKPSDIIYYYDDGILYDKNHVKVMDYDLNVKHEEERTKFANVDTVPEERFNTEYEDRLVRQDLDEDFEHEFDETACVICGEPIIGYGNNPRPVETIGRCCDVCNLRFVVPARLSALMDEDGEEDS